MAGTKNDRAKVYVGNIDFQAKEEDIMDVCEEIGPVVSLHLVRDKEHPDRHKGCCFCEYRDEETALSAIRNMNGRFLKGRQLKVDFPESVKKASSSNIINGSSDLVLSRKRKREGEEEEIVIDPNLKIVLCLMCYTVKQLECYLAEWKAIQDESMEKAEKLIAVCPRLPEYIQQAKTMREMKESSICC